MDHIEYLSRFVPFGKASYSDIVTELQEDVDAAIETKALEKAKNLCESGKGLVILTGNAGHGKTFIAREILLHFQQKDRNLEEDKRFVIKQLSGGDLKDPGVEKNGKRLAVHLDLSHTDEKDASKYIETALKESENRATLVCVNEGKLRQIISEWEGSEESQREISDGLEDCIRRGVASRSEHLYFINLNYQSVVSNEARLGSILERALKSWIDDGNKWASCESCLEIGECPIYRNRELLRLTGDDARDEYPRKRRSGISFLFRLAELCGHPTTIREMLQLLAYIITGGKSCNDLRTLKNKFPNGGWQTDYAFYRLIFGSDLDEDSLRQLPLIRKLRPFDPATGAWRVSDDRYIVSEDKKEVGGIDLEYLRVDGQKEDARATMRGDTKVGTGTESGKEEERDIDRAISILRRRDFFDLWHITDPDKWEEERSSRLNIRHYAGFVAELEKAGKSDDKTRELTMQIIKGLNAVQGISPWSKNDKRRSGKQLTLLHPAFIRLDNPYKALNKDIPLNKQSIWLSSEPNAWSEQKEELLKVKSTTDYLPVTLYFSVKIEEKTFELPLSLQRFSYIVKAGEGCFSKTYYAADIARIHSFMAMVSDAIKHKYDPASLTVIHDLADYQYEFDENKISA